jgi:hypothetical protein
MKHFSLVLFLPSFIFSIPALSQIEFDEENQSASYSVVEYVENSSKEEMYARAKIWIAGNLKSSDTQVFYDDDSHQQIIATGNLHLKDKALQINRILNYKLTVYFKEDRYKLVVDQMIMDVTNTSLDRSNQARSLENVTNVYKKHHKKNKKKRTKLMDELDEVLAGLAQNFHNSLSLESTPDSSDW